MSYKINVLGAGPAGLYAAALLKKNVPDVEIQIYEQRPQERGKDGLGFIFNEDVFRFFRKLGEERYQSISCNNPQWNQTLVRGKNGTCGASPSSRTSSGLTREKVMSILEEEISMLKIPVNYNTPLTSENFARYTDATLVIIATGAHRFLSENQVRPFRIHESISDLSYYWYGLEKTVSAHQFVLNKRQGIPYVMNTYPVAKTASACVVEVLSDHQSLFLQSLEDAPPSLPSVRLRAAQFPLYENILLIGDAGGIPYFCEGLGLTHSFYVGEKLCETFLDSRLTLQERLNMFSVDQGRFYLDSFYRGLAMIERKMHVLNQFDELSENEQLRILTGKIIKQS
ncbi:MAG: NAD(P)-binding protein [Nanoarchaeota archaeon]